jgi:hypothetical protein
MPLLLLNPMSENKLSKQYSDINADKWIRIKRAVSAYGLTINRDSGKGSAVGVTLSWAFYPTMNQLAVTIRESSLITEEAALEFVNRVIESA